MRALIMSKIRSNGDPFSNGDPVWHSTDRDPGEPEPAPELIPYTYMHRPVSVLDTHAINYETETNTSWSATYLQAAMLLMIWPHADEDQAWAQGIDTFSYVFYNVWHIWVFSSPTYRHGIGHMVGPVCMSDYQTHGGSSLTYRHGAYGGSSLEGASKDILVVYDIRYE